MPSSLGLAVTLGNRRGSVKQPTLELLDGRKPSGKPIGDRSLRSSVLPILQDAGGSPLTTTDILERARAMGADSAAKEPTKVVDLILYTLKKRKGAPIQRVGPQTWRWVGRG